ncbi:MAG: DUF2721 domain-containing protein [Lacunisphaera sp.]
MESLSALSPLIRPAITPVILISGMGALMIALANRLARIVDCAYSKPAAIPPWPSA